MTGGYTHLAGYAIGYAHLTRIGDPYRPKVKRLIDRFPISILKEILQDCHMQTEKLGLTFHSAMRGWLEVAKLSVEVSVSSSEFG